MGRSIWSGALALLSLVPAGWAQAPAALPAEEVRLANGLRVLLAPDPQARLVSVRVDYYAGSADDPPTQHGLAHLTEHLVASSTEHIPSVAATLRAVGAVAFNATTTFDTTSYFESVAPERLPTALWIESERMGHADSVLSADRVLRERPVLRNEESQRRLDALLGSLPDFTFGDLFPLAHPYARAGTRESVELVLVADVRQFLARWYRPANATLAIAGRFDRVEAVDLVRRYFAELPAVAVPVRLLAPTAPTPSLRLVLGAPVSAKQVTVAWRTPPLGDPDDAALDLVSSILTGSGNERLRPALVTGGLTTGATSRESSLAQGSVFSVSAGIGPHTEPDAVVAAIRKTLVELAAGVRPKELERARQIRALQLWSEQENTGSRASLMSSLARVGLEPGPGYDWGASRYQGFGAGELAEVVRRWLVGPPGVAVIIEPDLAAPARGLILGRGELK